MHPKHELFFKKISIEILIGKKTEEKQRYGLKI